MKPQTIGLAVPLAAADQPTAGEVFDVITGASYRGYQFRQVLRENPEAMRAATMLAAALKAAGLS